jgi:hypothetical protein
MPNAKGFQVRLSPEDKDNIRLLYWNGAHHDEIIAKYGCSTGAFWNIVRDMRQAVLEHRFDVQLAALGQVPEAERGWVAGIIDGEGYVGVAQTFDKRRDAFTLMPRLEVHSTTRAMQDELKRVLGVGHVYEKKHRRANEKTIYAWSIWSAAVVGPILAFIEPYLVVKREVASIVRMFCERRVAHDMEPYTAEDLATLKTVHRLNRRGVVDRRRRAAY